MLLVCAASGDVERAAELLDACIERAGDFGMTHLEEQARMLHPSS
jgi:hypothetical protein